MDKKEIMKSWIRNLSNNYGISELSDFRQIILNDILNKKSIEQKFKKMNSGQFGDVFEVIVAYALSNLSLKGLKYILKERHSLRNNGIDIILPIERNHLIWMIQVKTGKAGRNISSKESIALFERSDEFLRELQACSDFNEFKEKWTLSDDVFKLLISNKYKWKIKCYWLSEEMGKKEDTNNVSPTTIEELFLLGKEHDLPQMVEHNKDHDFVITAGEFSFNNKAITIHENPEGENPKKDKSAPANVSTIITPIKISDLLSFLEKINSKFNSIDSAFSSNVRDFKGYSELAKKMIKSLNEKDGNFFKKNNGITAIASNITFEANGTVNTCSVAGMNIINGQQTARAIWKSYEEGNLEDAAKDEHVLLRAHKTSDRKLIKEITIASNSQSSVDIFEILSTYEFNKTVHTKLLKECIFYYYRTGTTEYSQQYSKISKVYLREILKHLIIDLDENVWIKNSFKKTINNIVFDNDEENKTNVCKLINGDEKTIVENFARVARLILSCRKHKDKIEISESYDMFSYFFMKDKSKAIEFIELFNETCKEALKNRDDKIKNDASFFKTETHSGNLFGKLKTEFAKISKVDIKIY